MPSKRILKLYKQRDEIEAKITSVQNSCKHSNCSKTFHADTGNYDPTCDQYWTSFVCLECDKRWDEYQ